MSFAKQLSTAKDNKDQQKLLAFETFIADVYEKHKPKMLATAENGQGRYVFYISDSTLEPFVPSNIKNKEGKIFYFTRQLSGFLNKQNLNNKVERGYLLDNDNMSLFWVMLGITILIQTSLYFVFDLGFVWYFITPLTAPIIGTVVSTALLTLKSKFKIIIYF